MSLSGTAEAVPYPKALMRWRLLNYAIARLLNPYHSPALIIFLILRLIRSRLSALIWLI